MGIVDIVETALSSGYLTPTMEAEIARICDNTAELSDAEQIALNRLMGAWLAEEVVTFSHKQFTNMMEELILTETINQVLQIDIDSEMPIDISDIVAYALNRLPPLYATTREGANFQRSRATDGMRKMIKAKVSEAVDRYLENPQMFSGRLAIGTTSSTEILTQINSLLHDYAVSVAV